MLFSRNLFKYSFMLSFLLVLSSIFIGQSTSFMLKTSLVNQNEVATPLSSQIYELHSPILIESDGDFGSYTFNGTGSREDPYLIEGYNITRYGWLTMAIDIRNTHSFFIITHCVIYAEYIGIKLDNVQTGTSKIIENRFYSLIEDGGAITLSNTQNCTIEGNIGTNFMQGIHLNEADNNIIKNNYFYDIIDNGISIRYSNSNNITNNRIRNSKAHGIALVGISNNNIIHHNIIEGCAWGNNYNIDGVQYNINPTSQGYDEGYQNTWYDSENKQGNTWSDYFGIGPYHIDGTANAFDLYPNHTTGLTPFIIIIITTPILIGLVLVIYQFYYKKRKHQKREKKDSD